MTFAPLAAVRRCGGVAVWRCGGAREVRRARRPGGLTRVVVLTVMRSHNTTQTRAAPTKECLEEGGGEVPLWTKQKSEVGMPHSRRKKIGARGDPVEGECNNSF